MRDELVSDLLKRHAAAFDEGGEAFYRLRFLRTAQISNAARIPDASLLLVFCQDALDGGL